MADPVAVAPLALYEDALANGSLTPDTAQRAAVEQLDSLWHALQQPLAPEPTGWFARFRSPPKAEHIKGVYLWGGVGRGKTHFCDLFFDALPFDEKVRLHYHRFMQRVHAGLRARADQQDPLPSIAAELSREARVLVLDEMHINDITDAMLMHGLLTALFDLGVTLVTTSNVPPDELYRDGLQRARFLPAIALLKTKCQVVHLDSDTDYRLRTLERVPVYYTPSGEDADAAMAERFAELAPVGATRTPGALRVNGRDIAHRGVAGGVLWCAFAELCETARASIDYIEIAREFHSVLISDVPVMDQAASDAARRFVNLIDELYDRNVVVIMSADADPEHLYTGKRMAFEFVRAASRLREMGTRDYLALPHLG
ncbi:MAG: cell division protein ZapE [Pseudomonadota bacterium]